MRSGAAVHITQSILGLAGENPYLLLATICGMPMAFTNIINAQAAAVLMFPIALNTATLLGATDTLIAALGGYLEAKRALPPALKAQLDQVLLVLPLLTNLRRQIYFLKHLLSCQFQPL